MSKTSSTEQSVMKFEMKHKLSPGNIEKFNEFTAPNWLTGRGIRLGAITNIGNFWHGHVLTLTVGESVETSTRIITRIQ